MHKQKEFSTYWGLLLVVVFYGVLHIFTKQGMLDDARYQGLFWGNGLLVYLNNMYNTWSSRIVIDIIASVVLQIPFSVWRLLDTLAFGTIYYGFHYLFEVKGKNNFFLAMAICSYIFLQMASAGWGITSLTYTWTMTSAILCLMILKRSINNQSGLTWIILYSVCMIYACNYETMAGILLLLYTILLAGYWRKKANKTYLYIGLMLQIFSIAFIVTCKGNHIRMQQELANMPDFGQLNYWGKLRIGIVSTYEHFVSIPNVLFGVFCLTVFLAAWKRCKNLWQKVVAIVPMSIDIVLSFYYLFHDIIFGGKRNYVFAEPEMIISSRQEGIRQAVLITLFLVTAATILYSVWNTAREKKVFYTISIILMTGFTMRMAVCFSPSIYASGTRTFNGLYFALIAAITVMLQYLNAKYERVLIAISLSAGMALNLCLTVIPFLQNYS